MALKPIDPKPQYPSGGMSDEDTGGQDVQRPALEAQSASGNATADGDLPSMPGVSGFGQGPTVIVNVDKGDKYPCAPGKPGAESGSY